MKVAAIVPAYNEEKTIGTVVTALKKASAVDEIIVVSDGSEDNTAVISKKLGVTVIELEENVGKGGAMDAGAQATEADILLFIDADLVGLSTEHIDSLLDPILNNHAEMTIGIFDHGRLATDLAQKITPFLSGQRAIYRNLFLQIPGIRNSRYGVEVALSKYASKQHTKVTKVYLPDLSQVMKEEKHGFWRGIVKRIKMYWEILRAVKL